MLITDSFVLLNYPKSGSTFARTVIKEIYQQRLAQRTLLRKVSDRFGFTSRPFIRELALPNIRVTHANWPPDQHGCYCQIPEAYRNRDVVTVIRNPFERFLSAYEFRWWEKYPPVPKETLAEHFPSFPNLDIDDYVRLGEFAKLHMGFYGGSLDGKIGIQTIQFIQMFFKNPESVLNKISDKYIDSEQVFEDLAPIIFLKQENLNKDLADFLLEKFFSQEEAEYILSKEKINVTQNRVPDRNILWTKHAIDYIERHDRLIFRILAAKGIVYQRPTEL